MPELGMWLFLLGPIGAAYDFCTNPMAPPQIFAAQFEEGFGHPPGANLPARPKPKLPGKRVFVTRT